MTRARELNPAVNFLFTFPPYRYLAAMRLEAILYTVKNRWIYAPQRGFI
jgi:hypothetical protein